MGNTEVFKAQVVLNAEQAKNTLTQLEGHLKELKEQRKATETASENKKKTFSFSADEDVERKLDNVENRSRFINDCVRKNAIPQ